MSRRLSATMLFLALLVVTTAPAFASERAPVNPPGWVGGLILLLAVLLAVATGIWARSR